MMMQSEKCARHEWEKRLMYIYRRGQYQPEKIGGEDGALTNNNNLKNHDSQLTMSGTKKKRGMKREGGKEDEEVPMEKEMVTEVTWRCRTVMGKRR